MNKSILQEKEIGAMAHRQVMAALREILSDSDRGLALKAGFLRRIKKSLRLKDVGKVANLVVVENSP